MPKKKQKKSKKILFKHSLLLYINIFIISLSIILLAVIVNELFFDKKEVDVEKSETIKLTDIAIEDVAHEKFEEKTKALEIEYVDDLPYTEELTIIKQKPIFQYEETNTTTSQKKYEDNIKQEKIEKNIEKKANIVPKPKLSIIIDDITASWQVKRIQDIGYPITMAFLPPNSRHKNSAKIAQNVKNHMIHLPVEATSKRFEEGDTLHVDDSYEIIEKRIAQVKKHYPEAKYLNNHTGSKFTSNPDAMDKLFKALKKYNFIFVDSRTTSKSVTKKYAKKYDLPYLSRNIFLDNKQDKTYIQNQLKKSVRIAKKKGQAIAIGHPHQITIKTLKESKDLLQEVDVVYIHQIKIND